jgi:hypothetical protein
MSLDNCGAANPSDRLRTQVDAYLVRCAKVNSVAADMHIKSLEDRIRNELLPDRSAFRRVRVKPNPSEVLSYALGPGGSREAPNHVEPR